MRILHIGHYEEGSTTKMRGDYLKEILIPEEFKIIDINIPLQSTHRIFRSLGWRTKKGSLIKNINNFILDKLDGNWSYDLVHFLLNSGVVADLVKQACGKIVYSPVIH